MAQITKEAALEYHKMNGVPGKISVTPTKPLETQYDLGLAYTPGVAYPVLEIEKDPNLAYEYTSKGNLVAVITNGTAILGLGDRGPLASKPVMEGKSVLFKKFADVDSIDVEVNSHDPERIVEVVEAIGNTFGGINLEDIKAPECFYIETTCQSKLDIPVFHDDQHGTAIIVGAALLNAMVITGKKLKDIKIAFSGAGAAAVSSAKHFIRLGVPKENIFMCDTKGLIHNSRPNLTPEKQFFAQGNKEATLGDVLEGADMLVGLSIADCVTPDMIKKMNKSPLIFVMSNPDPEIKYELARSARPDAMIGTGRSDYPNQINNVLGFPFIFRGALDVRARAVNDEMKAAASYALAELAKQPVPAEVCKAYNVDHIEFGLDYIVPKPFDKRVCLYEAPAVAKAAMDSGVARIKIDLEEYKKTLKKRLNITY